MAIMIVLITKSICHATDRSGKYTAAKYLSEYLVSRHLEQAVPALFSTAWALFPNAPLGRGFRVIPRPVCCAAQQVAASALLPEGVLLFYW